MIFVECLENDTALSKVRDHYLAKGVVWVYWFIEDERQGRGR